LVNAWAAAGPAVRREIQEAIFARAERIPTLLDAIGKKTVLPQQLDAARIAQLRKHPDAKLRARAERLLAGAIDLDRQKVIAEWKGALDLKSDVEKGRAVFRKNCATCHRLEDVGTEVGPDLRTALRDKTSEQLLISILDPSREVDRRFTNYIVETKAGRGISGMIAAESATSVTLRRAEKAEDVVLRVQIESLTDTGKSLMPDGLEKQLSKQDLADVIEYLRSIR
jgi:putative heme-binding domain-containing protein